MMSFTTLDIWCSGSSALFLALAASRAWRARAHAAGALLGLGFASFVAAVGVLLTLSVVFRFSDLESMRPSPGYPFFSNGRLIGGTLVPFATLYLAGLGAVTRRPLVVVMALAPARTVAEFVLSVDVFRSRYNWFHLVAAATAL